MEVEALGTHIGLHRMSDTPLIKELVAIDGEIVEGILYHKFLLLLGLILLQEPLKGLKHQLTVNLIELIMRPIKVLFEEILMLGVDSSAVLLIEERDVGD
jgi:hypothetical protein